MERVRNEAVMVQLEESSSNLLAEAEKIVQRQDSRSPCQDTNR